MTPVDQRVLDHDPARGRFGDCLRACVASVLELPYEAVPQFAVADDWVERLQEWLAPRGTQSRACCTLSQYGNSAAMDARG